jgi:hypothetical protein
MKLRKGFVSNSSSSSFIVVFPKKPDTVEELYDMMFPRGLTELEYYETTLTTKEISKRVLKELVIRK